MAPDKKYPGSKASRRATWLVVAATASPASTSAKYAPRFTSTRRRVAPRNSGKANGVAPILAMVVNRLNRWTQICHGKLAAFETTTDLLVVDFRRTNPQPTAICFRSEEHTSEL